MTILVDRCSDGTFRLTDPQGRRESISNELGDRWDRDFASQALDLYQHVYHYKRRGIRFCVR